MPERYVTHKDLSDLAEGILNQGSEVRFRVCGTSMLPFLKDGDLATVQKVDPSFTPLRVGDVVLCQLGPAQLRVHRLVRIVEEAGEARYAVQGNAVAHPDGALMPRQILGRVVAIDRGGQVRPVSTRGERIAGVLWLRAAPWSQRFYRVARRVTDLLRRVHAPGGENNSGDLPH